MNQVKSDQVKWVFTVMHGCSCAFCHMAGGGIVHEKVEGVIHNTGGGALRMQRLLEEVWMLSRDTPVIF